jgi:hypothetical protein
MSNTKPTHFLARSLGQLLILALLCSLLPTLFRVEGASAHEGEHPYTPHPTWMSDLTPEIGDRPLSQVVLPGTHDAATSGLPQGFPFDIARAQDLTIAEQLDYGIRLFDLRFCKWPSDQVFYGCHLYASFPDRLDTIVNAIDAFTRDPHHLKEILILVVKNVTEGATAEQGQELCRTFYERFSDIMIRRRDASGLVLHDGSTTLNELWSTGARIIWMPAFGCAETDEATLANYRQVDWSDLWHEGSWANSPDAAVILAKMAGDLDRAPYDLTQIWNLQSQQTDILRSLEAGANSVGPQVLDTLFNQWLPGDTHHAYGRLNAIWADFPELLQLVERAISANQIGPSLWMFTTVHGDGVVPQQYLGGWTKGTVHLEVQCSQGAVGWGSLTVEVDTLGPLFHGTTDVITTPEIVDEDGHLALLYRKDLQEDGLHRITVTCQDAGGKIGRRSFVVQIDQTPPTIISTTAVDPLVWHNSPVAVSFTCYDDGAGFYGSGIATNTVAAETVTTEGAGQSVTSTGACGDQAGNSASPLTVGGINIDLTKPVLTGRASPAANSSGWNNTDVTVTFTCDDYLSGVQTHIRLEIALSGEGAGQSATSLDLCTDQAGNRADPATVTGINIDKTPPLNAAGAPGRVPDRNGWYNQAVEVIFTGSDTLSGIAGCTTAAYSGPDSPTASANGSCTDLAGNASAAVASSPFQYDATAPTLNASVAPNPVLLNGRAEARPNASDTTSGVDWARCRPANTASVGAKTVACAASDVAGNTTTASAAYNVIFNFVGFFAPVDNPPEINTAVAGRTIPLRWRLTDANGKPVTNLTGVTVTAVNLSCGAATTPDRVKETSAGALGLLNHGNGIYQFNWATPKGYANSCKTLKLDLGEGPGMERSALFRFK